MDRAPRRGQRWLRIALVAAALTAAGCASESDGVDSAGPSTTTAVPADAAGNRFVDGVFRSEEGRFSVRLPRSPRRLAQQERVDDVTLDIVVFDVAVSDDEAYQISFVEYPEALGPLDPDRALEGSVAGAAARVRGSIEGRRRLTYLGHPAIDADLGAALPISTRSVLVGRRLYTLQQVGPAGRSEVFERMLTTFTLS